MKAFQLVVCILMLVGAGCDGLRASRRTRQSQSCGNAVRLYWDAPTVSTGIVSYRLYASREAGSYAGLSAAAEVPAGIYSATVQDLDIGSYFFVARSYDGKLESGDSNEVQVSFSACSQAALIRSGEGIQYIDVKDLPPEELPSKNLPSRE